MPRMPKQVGQRADETLRFQRPLASNRTFAGSNPALGVFIYYEEYKVFAELNI